MTDACLGLAQTLAFASSYYLAAMLATAMARDLALGAMGFAALMALPGAAARRASA